MPEPTIPPIVLVRLRSQLPDGAVVGESRRVCHLVPLPDSGDVPQVLRAYCGTPITPGSADLLGEMAGMPCEACLAKSRIPAFGALRSLPFAPGHPEVGGWADHGFPPHTRVLARFVVLVLLQSPDRRVTVGEIAKELGQDGRTVHLILLIFAAIGWVQPITDEADPAWIDRAYRLSERGASLAGRMLARGLTSGFVDLAAALGLDTRVITSPDALGPGGCSCSPSGAPTGHHPDPDRTSGDHVDDGEAP